MARYTLARRVFWLTGLLAWVVIAGVLAEAAFNPENNLSSRLYGGVVYATSIMVPTYVVVVGLATWVNWRHFRRQYVPESVWEVTTSQDSLTMSGPLGIKVTLPFQALSMVRVVGDWVLIRQKSARPVLAWPREVFADAALVQMQEQSSPGRR